MRQQCFTAMSGSERAAGGRVTLTACNPALDLLAIVLDDVDLVLQRHFWKKAWSYRAPKPVTALAWHPSGQSVSLALQDGSIQHVDTELGTCVHVLDALPGCTAAHALHWTTVLHTELPRLNESDLMGELPALPEPVDGKVQSAAECCSALGAQPAQWASRIVASMSGEPSRRLKRAVLTACYGRSSIVLYADGVFGFYSISAEDTDESRVSTAEVSADLQHLYVIGVKADGSSVFNVYSLQQAFWNTQPTQELLWRLTYSSAHLYSTHSYIRQVVAAFSSTWEDLLIEIDDKFVDFAKQKSMLCGEDGKNSTVADDLLVLLCFGTVSSEMEQLLLHSLTEKGLKKITASLEVVYGRLQQLLVGHLDMALTALTYYTQTMQAHAQLATAGEESSVESELLSLSAASGSCALKVSELTTVMLHNRAQLTAFFQWLLCALMRQQDTSGNHGQGAGDLPVLLTLDSPNGAAAVDSLVNFIRSTFGVRWTEERAAEGKRLFRLEKVSQYLQDANIAVDECNDTPEADGSNWWHSMQQQLCAAGLTSLADDDQCRSMSLVQCVNSLSSSMRRCELRLLAALSSPTLCLTKTTPLHSVTCAEQSCHVELQTNGSSVLLCTLIHESSSVQRCVVHTLDTGTGACSSREVQSVQQPVQLLNTCIYNQSTLLLLCSNDTKQYVCKVRLTEDTLQVDLNDESQSGVVNGARGAAAAGSSVSYGQLLCCAARRVAALVSHCRTKIRLLDMEPDEETTSFSASNNQME